MRLLALALLLAPSLALALGQVTLTWTAPTQNTDGSPLTEPVTYTVLYGTSVTALSQQVGGIAGLTTTITGLTPGATYYFEAVAVDSVTGLGSAPTNPVSATIAAGSPETLTAPSALAVAYAPPGAAGSGGAVSLAAVANVHAFVTDGSSVVSGAMDGYGDAYSATLLGPSVSWSGTAFPLLAPGVANGVSSVTVPLPSGQYSTLLLLGTGVNGTQTAQTFTVNYADGTSTAFTQSLSDWYYPQGYAGEARAVSMAYRITSNGSQDIGGPFLLYGYSFALNPAKTVASLVLPANRDVVVLAVALH